MSEPGTEEARRIATDARDRVRFEEDALALADQVYRVARHLVGSPEEAEDLMQETYARAFVHVDEKARVVRTTLSKRMIEESPKLGDVSDAAIARYYGLAGGGSSPATEGYGEVGPGDPAIGAERQELASGLEPAASERARMREHPEQLGDPPADLRKNPPPHHLGRRQAL